MDVTTVAGSSQGHQDGQGPAAKFNSPVGVTCCPDGGAVISEAGGKRVRQVSAGGAVATFAGSGAAGSLDGQGTAARFTSPQHIARDAAGNLYLADAANNVIRKTTPGGLVTTFAGTGAKGSKDGLCADATFCGPCGVAVSPTTGNIIIADTDNHRVRVILVADGCVYTLAGGEEGFADGAGLAAKFDQPFGVACDDEGNVCVADYGNHRIRKIAVADRTVTTLAGSGTAGHQDGAGAQAEFYHPLGVAVDGDGNVVVADQNNHRVRLVTRAGAVSTLAGSGTVGSADGQGAAASFNNPNGVAVGAAGEVLVTEYDGHRLRRVAAGLNPPALMRAQAQGTEPPPLPEQARVATDLGKLLGEGEDTYHDVEFLVGGETIGAHKGVLAARCEYFSTMLGSSFAEGSGGGGGGATSGGAAARAPLPVVDTTPEAFRVLLRFLYTGAVDLEDASVLDVACLSQRYLVVNLQEQCFEHCRENVSPANAVPWLVLADTHKFGGLRATLLAYVAENRVEIDAAADTLDILRGHPELIYALFMAPAAKRRKTGN